jgi:hypothetical protein
MTVSRRLVSLSLAALIAIAACGGDDGDDGFFTAPPTNPPAGGPVADIECEDDVTSPVLRSISASPSELWPPNHGMVRVNVQLQAEDPCRPLDIRIISVSSNQPVNGRGDGDTAPDWDIVGPLAAMLRAERAGHGEERIYEVRVRFADAVGNEGFENVEVRVPHDRRRP